MESLITILSVGAPYNFTPEGSAEPMSGCSMMYIATDKLTPCVNDGGILGYQPLKESMPYDFYARIKEIGVPCIAKAHYVMRNSQGKQVLRIDGIDFIKK